VICEHLRPKGALYDVAKLLAHIETHLNSAPSGLFDTMSVSSKSSCAEGRHRGARRWLWAGACGEPCARTGGLSPLMIFRMFNPHPICNCARSGPPSLSST